MNIQNSYEENQKGTLYIVPTPIGNLEDITYRAVRILSEVDLIAAEDTRHTKKLLHYFEIEKETISYHEHNRSERIPYLLRKLDEGKDIALVSDAGMPAISDPGYELVQATIKKDLSVIVLPGANAAITALVGSGLPTEQFLFIGFLPRRKKEQKELLERLQRKKATLILYESPHRVAQTLHRIAQFFGKRRVALARELTKVYEQYIRGTVEEVKDWVENNPVRGECVLVIEGNAEAELKVGHWWEELSIVEHVAHYEKETGLPHKEAMRKVAQDRKLSRRDVYEAIHVKKDD